MRLIRSKNEIDEIDKRRRHLYKCIAKDNIWMHLPVVEVGLQNYPRQQPIYFINALRAKFFRGIISIYLYFMSFLHINTTQVVEILPQIRQE